MTSFDKSQVVILSSVEWDAAWQRHQAFAAQWAAAGHEVFFVENTGFRNPGLRDLPRLWRKALRLVSREPAAPRQPPPAGVRVVNPLVLPPTLRAFRKANAGRLVPRLVGKLRELGLGPSPVAIAYLPTATTLSLLDQLKPALTVYDCVANFRGLPKAPKDLSRIENALLGRSQLVVADSGTLFKDKSRLHPNVLELHHGVSPAFFIEPPPDRGYRRLCYFGTLWRAIDYHPIRALANAGFPVDLIGPRKERPPRLPRGVRWRPSLPHQELPEALASCDALLLPYAGGEFARGVLPAKIYECLATGRPVIASPLPALEPFRELVYRARTPAEWVQTARNLPHTESSDLRRERVKMAREHTQEKMFARLEEALRKAWRRRFPHGP